MTLLVQAIVRLLFVPILLLALTILVKGYSRPGDGFAAGVVASLAVLLQHVAFGRDVVARAIPLRAALWMVWIGLLISLAVVFFPLLGGGAPVTHFPPPDAEVAKWGSLELHTSLLFDIGVFLLVFGFTVGVLDEIAQREGEVAEEEKD